MTLQTQQQTFIYKVMIVGLSCGITMSAMADLGKVSTLVSNGVATAQATLGHMYHWRGYWSR